jgi:hypothetical protein
MLDFAGFCAPLANRFLLTAMMPSRRRIAFWGKVFASVSRRLSGVAT